MPKNIQCGINKNVHDNNNNNNIKQMYQKIYIKQI
jgi:hypothetical protein